MAVLTVLVLAAPGCANSGGKARPFGLGNGNPPLFSGLSMGRSRPITTLESPSVEAPTVSTTIGGARIIEPSNDRGLGVRDTSTRPGLFPFRWPWSRRTVEVSQPVGNQPDPRKPDDRKIETTQHPTIRLETIELASGEVDGEFDSSREGDDDRYDRDLRAVSAGGGETPDWVAERRRSDAPARRPVEARDDVFTPDITPWDRFRERLTQPIRTLNQLNPLRRGR